MIILGYTAILAYVFFLIFLLGPLVEKAANGETSRKIIHTMLFMVWVFIDIFFRDSIHQIIIPIIFLILNSLSYKFKIYKSVEREENNHLGTIYFAIAITVVMTLAYFFPVLYYPSGVAAFCLTFGDGFAALIGYNFPSRKLRGGKSILGFAACFAACALCLVAFRLIYWPDLTFAAILILAALAAISELVGSGLDNFTVTFVTFAFSHLLARNNASGLYAGLGIAAAIFCIVYLSNSITYYGALLAMVMVFCFTLFGGAPGITFLLLNYFSIFAIGLLRRKLAAKDGPKEKHSRDFLQILINGGLGTLFVVLAGIYDSIPLLIVSMVSIGGNFIDSVSSDVGTLAKATPFDPLQRRYVPRGLSGGMTVLGTLAALSFSLLIGLYVVLGLGQAVLVGLLVCCLVFLQSLVDTMMGSALQVKYRCPVCGAITEQTTHCDVPTEYHRGLKWMSNNCVNALSSTLITALAAVLIGVIL